MTGRTHDVAAMTTLTIYLVTQPLTHMSLATIITAIGVNIVGGMAPDIDHPAARLWRRIPAGSIIGRVVRPMLGNHRMLSHSLIGTALAGLAAYGILGYMESFVLVDMKLVWIAFMLGFLSHLVTDTFTKDGVPWLFPVPIRFGFPPLRFFRITTGKFVENGLIYPGLMLCNGYLVYLHYAKVIDFLRNYVSK